MIKNFEVKLLLPWTEEEREEHQEEYGVSEEFSDFLEISIYDIELCEMEDLLKINTGDKKIYVSEESMHIFELQDKDILEVDRWYRERQKEPEQYKGYPYEALPATYIVDVRGSAHIFYPGSVIDSHYYFHGDIKNKEWMPYKIIQRNGRPFIWPKEEV